MRMSKNSILIKKFIREYFPELYRAGKLTYLIEAVGELKYANGWVESNVLSPEEKLEVIIGTRDKEYMAICMNGKIGDLPDELRLILAQMLDCEEVKKTLSEKYRTENPEYQIQLPEGMKAGIEIESEGWFGHFFLKELWDGWNGKKEGEGLEVVSPILTGTTQDTQNIYKTCNALIDIGQDVSEQYGGHIHIGADYLSGTDSYINLLTMWCVSEKTLYLISNQENELTRKDAIIGDEYAKPISKSIKEALKNGTINLDSKQDLTDFIQQLKDFQNEERNLGINFLNVGSKEKNTIEFRIPNATLSPKVWIENINLFGGLVKVSEEIAKIQRKSEEERTEEEEIKLMLFEKMISQELDEAERLNILLTLTVGEKNKQAYVSRYESNKALMKKIQI